jgi:hypothetical protein
MGGEQMKEFLDKLYNATKGFKTKTSIVVLAVVTILQYLNLIDQSLADLIFKLAGSLGLYGVYDNVSNPAPK